MKKCVACDEEIFNDEELGIDYIKTKYDNVFVHPRCDKAVDKAYRKAKELGAFKAYE